MRLFLFAISLLAKVITSFSFFSLVLVSAGFYSASL
jgi:hypothetical protein